MLAHPPGPSRASSVIVETSWRFVCSSTWAGWGPPPPGPTRTAGAAAGTDWKPFVPLRICYRLLNHLNEEKIVKYFYIITPYLNIISSVFFTMDVHNRFKRKRLIESLVIAPDITAAGFVPTIFYFSQDIWLFVFSWWTFTSSKLRYVPLLYSTIQLLPFLVWCFHWIDHRMSWFHYLPLI